MIQLIFKFIVHGICRLFIRHVIQVRHGQSSPGTPIMSHNRNSLRGYRTVVYPVLILVALK